MRRATVLSFVFIAFMVIAFSNGNYANAQTAELTSLWELMSSPELILRQLNAQTTELTSLWEKYHALNSEYNAKLDALLDKFVAEHETDLDVLKAEFLPSVEDLNDKRDSLKTEYESGKNALDSEHDTNTYVLYSDYESEKNAMQDEHYSKTDALLYEFLDAMPEATAAIPFNLEAKPSDYASKLDAVSARMEASYYAKIAALEAEYEINVNALYSEYDANIRILNFEYEAKIDVYLVEYEAKAGVLQFEYDALATEFKVNARTLLQSEWDAESEALKAEYLTKAYNLGEEYRALLN